MEAHAINLILHIDGIWTTVSNMHGTYLRECIREGSMG